MKKRVLLISIILILIMAVGVSAISAQEKTQPINWKLTGAIMSLSDSEGVSLGSIFDVYLKGAPGAAQARGLGFSGPPVDKEKLPEGNTCTNIPGPDGVLFLEAQMTVHFEDGSMLFANAAQGGYVCFVPSFAYVPYDFAGGTGRFEGATGSVLFEIDAFRFNGDGKRALVTGETGTGTGEIELP